MVAPQVFGPKQAKTTLVSWGSNKGAIVDALKDLPDTNFIHFSWLWPFPAEQFKALVGNNPRLVAIEGNATSQLTKLIAQETGMVIKDKILKYDGRQFYPEEIIEAVKKL
jgi:2-oxoglutarate ferredoxin oxidoreductase subunit alpha